MHRVCLVSLVREDHARSERLYGKCLQLSAHICVALLMDYLHVPELFDIQTFFYELLITLPNRNAMSHHVHLCALLGQVVEMLHDVADVAAPTAEQYLFSVLFLLLHFWKRSHCDICRCLRLVCVIVLSDNNDLVIRRNDPTGRWLYLDAERRSDTNGNCVREASHKFTKLLANNLWPCLHVKLISVKSQQGLVHFCEARLASGHEHEPPQHVM
mmetsp:Transcript_58915/g.103105  ORF Transcript_58915/g.103105 Transcript_58915/m.103105 type:complete len:214 (-) Transcript_58915:985-1626(-)